ncbi:hypothetical protein MKW92_009731, partial [Papaver armeniacum]
MSLIFPEVNRKALVTGDYADFWDRQLAIIKAFISSNPSIRGAPSEGELRLRPNLRVTSVARRELIDVLMQ